MAPTGGREGQPRTNKDILDRLIRFQELTFALLEQQAAESRAGLREIQDSLDHATQHMPREWVRTAQRLQGDGQPAVVPATDGLCSFCRIQLPTLMFQEIRKHARIHQCPCCARILYLPEGGGLHMGTVPSRFGRGGVARFSSKGLMVPQLAGKTRDEAIRGLTETLVRAGWVNDPGEIVKAAMDREDLISTAVDHGLAFPHVRGAEGGGLVFALGLSKKGVRFGAPAGRLTRIIFFSVIPQAASNLYLRIMATLVRTFRQEPLRRRLLGCQEPVETWEALVEVTQNTLP
jgi:mannitol/fructose-specific phosphotransferase system IIA component (Ntr-type)